MGLMRTFTMMAESFKEKLISPYWYKYPRSAKSSWHKIVKHFNENRHWWHLVDAAFKPSGVRMVRRRVCEQCHASQV